MREFYLKHFIIPLKAYLERDVVKWLKGKEFEKVLELGAGDGTNPWTKAVKCSSLLKTDLEEMPGIDCVADITKLQFKDGEFDLVLCNQVLEHVFDFQKAIAELKRVTKKDGFIIVGVPFLFPEHHFPADYWRFTSQALKKSFGLPPVLESRHLNFWRKGYSSSSIVFQNK